jgi:Leucine-rich repeat (LRR) protein
MIEKITGISSLKNLKILSLGRNYIKNFSGLVTTILSFLLISIVCTERFKSRVIGFCPG